MNIEDKARLFKIAYKKLKSNLYYDKTLEEIPNQRIWASKEGQEF